MPLNQLVGRGVCPEVVGCLHLGVLQCTGTHCTERKSTDSEHGQLSASQSRSSGTAGSKHQAQHTLLHRVTAAKNSEAVCWPWQITQHLQSPACTVFKGQASALVYTCWYYQSLCRKRKPLSSALQLPISTHCSAAGHHLFFRRAPQIYLAGAFKFSEALTKKQLNWDRRTVSTGLESKLSKQGKMNALPNKDARIGPSTGSIRRASFS